MDLDRPRGLFGLRFPVAVPAPIRSRLPMSRGCGAGDATRFGAEGSDPDPCFASRYEDSTQAAQEQRAQVVRTKQVTGRHRYRNQSRLRYPVLYRVGLQLDVAPEPAS